MKEVSITATSVQRHSFTCYILKSESLSVSFFDSAFCNISLIMIPSCMLIQTVILKCFKLLELKPCLVTRMHTTYKCRYFQTSLYRTFPPNTLSWKIKNVAVRQRRLSYNS